ncbi:MAG: AIPR family protein [Deltaproteobacteria bacterium]|nr:AIPR family protein [Deltaproteobacteria bacterium]
MSILHLNQIKKHLLDEFKEKIDLSDVRNGSETDKENFFLTRSLAAYAIKYHAEISPEVASYSITDGGDDNGIDALYYCRSDKTLYIVQSKWIHSGKGEPENGDVKKFIAGIKDLFNLNFNRFNKKIQDKKDLITLAIDDFQTKYQLILTYTGINELAPPSKRDVDDFLDEINDASESVYFSIFNQKRLHGSLIKDVTGSPINQVITLRSWGRMHEPFKAFYGQINGQEIYTWWKKHRTKLFRENIRGVLGDTAVNSDITSTLENEPEKFWFYNNGITILAEEARKNMQGGSNTDYGQFSCKNVSIVNGAQTVSCIGKYGEKDLDKLANVFVNARIISLEGSSSDFGQEITKSNNRQNKVENSDFVSFDHEQIRLRDELAIEGINYQLNRSESNESSEKAFDLNDSTTALSCASLDVSLVVQLKREIGKLWDNLSKAPYKKLFNPEVTGSYVYNCISIQRRVDSLIDRKLKVIEDGREKSVLIHGNRLLSMFIFKDINPLRLKNPDVQYSVSISEEYLRQTLDKYFKTLYYIFENEYSNSVVPTFFKNNSKCQNIVDLVPEFIDYCG